ncbi:MAG: Rap1a/Tai family immunity protein [Alphaproteobacteria bacterium]
MGKQSHCNFIYITAFLFILAVGMFLFAGKSYAAQFSGDYLLKVCSVDKNGNERVAGGKIACQSYISGVIDYHNVLRAMGLTSGMDFCVPEKVTLNELHIRVLVYLYEHVKMHRNFVAAPAVSMALYSLYPCNK